MKLMLKKVKLNTTREEQWSDGSCSLRPQKMLLHSLLQFCGRGLLSETVLVKTLAERELSNTNKQKLLTDVPQYASIQTDTLLLLKISFENSEKCSSSVQTLSVHSTILMFEKLEPENFWCLDKYQTCC